MSNKPTTQGAAARPASTHDPGRRKRRRARRPDWRKEEERWEREQTRLFEQAEAATLAAMPDELREEVERHERELEREEQEEREEVERLRLSDLEGRIFLRLKHGEEVEREELAEWLYEVVLWDFGATKLRRLHGRLRARLFALNRKLEAAGYGARVGATRPGRLRMLAGGGQSRGAAWGIAAAPERRVVTPLCGVVECVDDLQISLRNGPLSAKELSEELRCLGYTPGTVKRARKRLGVVSRRKGFGGDGEWFVELPPD
jgi:hypothetical protein